VSAALWGCDAVRYTRATPIFLLAGLVLGGCRFIPEGAVEYDPPPIYRQWWLETVQCIGQGGQFDDVTWYRAPGPFFDCPAGDGNCLGWWGTNHEIYIANEWLGFDTLVRHEMIHELIGRGDHPSPPFYTPCINGFDPPDPPSETID